MPNRVGTARKESTFLHEAAEYAQLTRRLYLANIGYTGNQPLDREQSDREFNRQMGTFDQGSLRWLWPLLNLGPDRTLLSTGCGLAVRETHISHRMGLTIGLDMNLTSLATAHRKGQENRWPTAFVAGDAVRLPIRDASLDNVVDFGVSEHIYDLVGWMHEILRVLKPGGVWVSVTTNYCGLLTPTFRESAGFESPWHRVLAVPFVVGRYLSGVLGHYTQRIPRVEQAYGQYHGHIPQLKRHLDPEDLNAINPWEMQRLANTVGFDSVSARVTVSNRTFFHRLLSRLANRGPLLFIVPNTVLVARKA